MESELSNYNSFNQYYNINDDEVTPSQVDNMLCVLVQRGFLIAGFNSRKELLTIRYFGNRPDKIAWDAEFFNSIILNEPFLADTEKVKGLFLLSERNMIVPHDLYKEQTSKNWLRQIHFIEQDDFIEAYPLDADRAVYIMAIPGLIKNLVTNNFRNAEIKPLALYQFRKPPKIGLCLQAFVSAEQACAAIHIDGNLLWHRVFDYNSAEDIVFEGKYLCKENNYFATKLSILFNSLTAAEFPVLSEYSQYYPAMKSGEGNRIHTSWDAPVTLIQQLQACV
jgi:hypothetical protein